LQTPLVRSCRFWTFSFEPPSLRGSVLCRGVVRGLEGEEDLRESAG
jgi:hypothetical protein